MYDLLTEPVFPVEGASAPALSLPGVLANLSAGREITFNGLAAYQRQAWFCFLVQLGALALTGAERATPPEDEPGWRDLLAALAGDGADTAFTLVVEDRTRPAFLQPPIRSSDAWSKFRGPITEPDSIDILVLAKNHDVKMQRGTDAAPHHWVYALLNLQTLQGFLGRGNYGVARMNGGFSSRVFTDRVDGPGWAVRFRRDLSLLIRTRAAILKRYEDYYQEHGGIGLVWLEPWDAEHSITLKQLDPYFIEICRRVRLVAVDGKTGAMTRPSESARIEAAETKGVLGDPWAPLDTKKETALTIGAGGFDYRRIVQILTDAVGLPPSLRVSSGHPDGELDLQFSVLVRGQGRTDGLHTRSIPVPRNIADRLADPEFNEQAKYLSAQMLDDVGKFAALALRTGLRVYLQGAPDNIDFTDERVQPFTQAFDHAMDNGFLDQFWRRIEVKGGDEEAAHTAWQRWLAQVTTHYFNEGLAGLPSPTERRERARVAADNIFHAMLQKNLPMAFAAQSARKEESIA